MISHGPADQARWEPGGVAVDGGQRDPERGDPSLTRRHVPKAGMEMGSAQELRPSFAAGEAPEAQGATSVIEPPFDVAQQIPYCHHPAGTSDGSR